MFHWAFHFNNTKHTTMKYITNILPLYIIVLFAASCVTKVKIDIPYPGDKLVINSFITADSSIYCRITKSKRVNDPNEPLVPNGVNAVLFENGLNVGNLSPVVINNITWFTSNIKAKPLAAYKINVSATGLGDAFGEDIVPPKPLCEPLVFEAFNTSTINSNYNYRLQLKIKDIPNVKNYYLLRLYDVDTNINPVGPRLRINRNYQVSFLPTNVANNSSTLFDEDNIINYVFTDETFDGKALTLTMRFNKFNNGNTTGVYVAPTLYNISQSTYRYIKSVEDFESNQGDPFSEVVTVFNNIQNGYGIVGGLADSIMVMKRQ